ncbi:YHS domain-containing protein [Glycomyces sp. NPDC021274]|uniref:YHS domain-containing protein n=1 Tax=Glycomyces sp. NPDC021274 TaxID=3155120 RepID=UPI0033F5F3AA
MSEHDHHHGHDEPEQAADHCHGHGASAEQVADAGADAIAECPVMIGSTVVKADAEAAGLFRDYEGQRYWLCCDACGPLFDADPAKYATAAA